MTLREAIDKVQATDDDQIVCYDTHDAEERDSIICEVYCYRNGRFAYATFPSTLYLMPQYKPLLETDATNVTLEEIELVLPLEFMIPTSRGWNIGKWDANGWFPD